MSPLAPVIPLFATDDTGARGPARIPHPSLGSCPECGSERLAPLVRTGCTAPEAVRCECCALVLSMRELDAVHRGAGSTASTWGTGR